MTPTNADMVKSVLPDMPDEFYAVDVQRAVEKRYHVKIWVANLLRANPAVRVKTPGDTWKNRFNVYTYVNGVLP